MKLNKYIELIDDTYSAVVIIPVKKSDPLLIFKELGTPFYLASNFKNNDAFIDCVIYWKNEFLKTIPLEICDQYKFDFNEFLRDPVPTYLRVDDFPDGIYEVPIRLIQDGIVVSRKFPSLDKAKQMLIRLCKISETKGKGKGKGKDLDIILERMKFVLKEYKSLGCPKKPYPSKKIIDSWNQYVDKKFNSDNRYSDKYYINEQTVRRILDSFNRKEEFILDFETNPLDTMPPLTFNDLKTSFIK